MNISKIAFAKLAVGAIILLSVSISKKKDAGTYAKHALLKTVVYATKAYNNRRLQNTKVDCGLVDKVLNESKNCVYYLPSHGGHSTSSCITDSVLSTNEVLKIDTWASNTFHDKASDTFDAYPVAFPEWKATQIISDVSGICGNGKPLEDDLTQDEFNALIDQYLVSTGLPICEEYGETPANCEMVGYAINAVLAASNLGGSLHVAGISGEDNEAGLREDKNEAGLRGMAGVWRKILYVVSIAGIMWN